MKCLRRLADDSRVQIPGNETVSDVGLRRQLEMPAIESQIRRARLRDAASLINGGPTVCGCTPERCIGMKRTTPVPLTSRVPYLPTYALLCPECPHESVRVFTSERATQANRARAHGRRAMARETSSVTSDAQRVVKLFGSQPHGD